MHWLVLWEAITHWSPYALLATESFLQLFHFSLSNSHPRLVLLRKMIISLKQECIHSNLWIKLSWDTVSLIYSIILKNKLMKNELIINCLNVYIGLSICSVHVCMYIHICIYKTIFLIGKQKPEGKWNFGYTFFLI